MITENQVLAAQANWSKAIVDIGELPVEGREAKTTAILEDLYAFDRGDILFKPTKAILVQFRPTLEAALSYFINSNPKFPEDSGFALQPWSKVRFDNHRMILEENRAVAMGNYFFTDANTGKETMVEYTFGYILDKGILKIDVHHSSLPYNPGENPAS